MFFLLRDTPQSCGLPPIEEYKNDYPPGLLARTTSAPSRSRRSSSSTSCTNRYLWAIAVANAFVYFVRYGVVNWIPTYLETAKGFSFKESSLGWSLYEYAAIPGTIACGWMSDKVFKGRRAPATILFMALTLVAVVVYWLNLHGPLWIDYAALIAIGFLIYGPIMIIGLHALDLVPKKAAGTAAGFTGLLRLRVRIGHRRHRRGLDRRPLGLERRVLTMVACCVLTIVFSAFTLGHKAKSAERS